MKFPRIGAALSFSSAISLATAFQSAHHVPIAKPSSLRLRVASVESPSTSSSTSKPNQNQQLQYDCDDDANCELVPCNTDEGCRISLDVRIHGTWYDLSGWRKSHPSGSHWIDMYDGRDATDVMDAFHTAKAKSMYQKLPKSQVTTELEMVLKDTETQLAFRELRTKLEVDGWFERDYFHEAKLLGIVGSLFVGAGLTATHIDGTLHPISTVLLSLAFTNSGWIGHDYIHGVDKYCEKLRMFSPLFGRLGCTWWSDKHNNHHAHTNEMGVDGDMAEGPLLYSYAPDPANDSPVRKFQHILVPFTFSLLFWLWRVRSFQVVVNAIEEKRPRAKEELYALLAHYFVLLTFIPPTVYVPAIFLSGMITAFIVTPTHQNDVFFEEEQPDWVTAQFLSTRNAVLTNPFSTWLWGGMKYQLEHHLFPSMPRSKYPALRPIIQQWASQQEGLEYLESGEWEILKSNWELYRDVAKAEPVAGAPNGDYRNLREKVAS